MFVMRMMFILLFCSQEIESEAPEAVVMIFKVGRLNVLADGVLLGQNDGMDGEMGTGVKAMDSVGYKDDPRRDEREMEENKRDVPDGMV